MSLLSLNRVSKSYFGKIILKEVDLTLDSNERLALVGENGAGKTTLLRLIQGLETPDSESGPIVWASGVVSGYLEQHLSELETDNTEHALMDPQILQLECELRQLETALSDEKDLTRQAQLMRRYTATTARFESLDGYSYQHRLAETLAGLGLDRESCLRPLRDLSGGERMRASLARLLIREPDVLLLDEPTNHLDQDACEWLARYLQNTRAAVIFISHDRAFIDRVATKTAELNGGCLTIYSGNYSKFVELKRTQQELLAHQLSQLEQKIERQNEITQTMLSHRKISSYHSSQKKAKRLSEELTSLRDRLKKSPARLNFKIIQRQNESDPKRVVLDLKDFSVQFSDADETLFEPMNWTLRNGERVILAGPNGCGKTTLLRAIMGEETGLKGNVWLAEKVNFGFLGQVVHFERESDTVLHSLQERAPELSEARLRSTLAQYGFRDVDVFKRLEVLSGGERARLYLCHLLTEQPDVLFLDEPTNHLDIYSREILEESLLRFPGTILAVSHDRYFIEKIAQSVLGFVGRTVRPFDHYSDYLDACSSSHEKKSMQPDRPVSARPQQHEPVSAKSESFTKSVAAKPNRNLLWTVQELTLLPSLGEIPALPANRTQQRRFQALGQQNLTQLELLIGQLESEKENSEMRFEANYSAEIYHDYSLLLSRLELAENLYLKLMEILESDRNASL